MLYTLSAIYAICQQNNSDFLKTKPFLTSALSILLTLSSCVNNAKPTQLRKSDFSIILPAGYVMTDDDFDEDQVAYYYKDDKSIDFDVYQWEKGDEYTLESEANHFANEYGTVAEHITINDILGMKYISTEEYAAVDEIINTLKKN